MICCETIVDFMEKDWQNNKDDAALVAFCVAIKQVAPRRMADSTELTVRKWIVAHIIQCEIEGKHGSGDASVDRLPSCIRLRISLQRLWDTGEYIVLLRTRRPRNRHQQIILHAYFIKPHYSKININITKPFMLSLIKTFNWAQINT